MRSNLIALVCGLGLGLVASAQEQRVVNGRKYTVHVVEAGQTLYGIAKARAVPVDVLLAANPGAQDGLSIGEELLVPQDAVAKKELRSAPVLRADGELVHVVRKKETLFGIARQYDVDMNALLERNPAGLDLKEGMELVIPVTRVSSAPEATLRPAQTVGGLDHVVAQGETLYALGKRYAVDPEAIRSANGGLPEGLKAGSTIIIPKLPAEEEKPVGPVVQLKEHMRYKVGLLLPFAIDRNDSVLASVKEGEVATYYEPTRIAVQFHNGARMAIDSLKSLGLHADIDVVDLGDDMGTWNAEIKRPEIRDFDLFIGPFHRTAIEQLARVNDRAHVVCPVPQSNKVILGMPNVSKVTPSRSDLVKLTARFIVSRFAKENIILARPDIAAEKDVQEQVRTAFNEALLSHGDRLRDTVLLARPGKRDIGDLIGKLDASRLNVIFAPSDDVEFVTSLVTKLKQQTPKYRIRLVGMESWNGMPSLSATDLDLLDFTFAAPTFFDPEDPRVRSFMAQYRKRFASDVDEYALLGFDVTFFYLKALMTQGLGFAEHFDLVRTEPLHMGFRMTRAGPENGFRNEYGIVLEQEDLRLIRVR